MSHRSKRPGGRLRRAELVAVESQVTEPAPPPAHHGTNARANPRSSRVTLQGGVALPAAGSRGPPRVVGGWLVKDF